MASRRSNLCVARLCMGLLVVDMVELAVLGASDDVLLVPIGDADAIVTVLELVDIVVLLDVDGSVSSMTQRKN
ncbi:hypothetical protein CHS0354_030256 [Potamilus streckersoni]|uniref:Secreted protein n=1 Tax=Potamilus streckersoni TaxID=2493646 RepID=A0AAE0RT05_9BIVA|nr:hypothetical protein CHS0354_030256 [Potamilus streckersoni]